MKRKILESDSTSSELTPNKLPDKVINFLNERISDEYSAYYLYNCASNWCLDKAYFKAGSYFQKESQEELNHSRRLQDYLVQWNVLPKITPVEVYHEFSSLVDIINQAYQIEYDLYKKYNEISKIILVADPATFDFLEEFRQIQNKSVAEFSDLLNALKLINPDNKFELLYFEQTYF